MSGSVPLAQRSPAPDLARGTALVGIALANAVAWIDAGPTGVLLKPVAATALDRTVDVLTTVLADNRGLPLFALLFGYGIAIMQRSEARRGRFALSRRFLALALIGLFHGALLFPGDIIHVYALLGLLYVLLATSRLGRSGALLAGVIMLSLWGWLDGTHQGSGLDPALTAPGTADAFLARTSEMGRRLASLPAQIAVLAPIALGHLLGRQRYLEGGVPRQQLTRDARVFLTISVLGALPLASLLLLDPSGEHTPELLRGAAGTLHQLTGLLGALGGAALAGLLCHSREQLPRAAARMLAALAALGRMSLTGYVLQSVIAAVVFPASMLGLAQYVGTAGASALMVLAWLASLGLAYLLRSRRGPLETLLRQLA